MSRGLRAEVYTGPFTSANGGVSERVNFVTVIGDDIPEVYPATDHAPAVRLERRGGSYVSAVPVEPPPSDRTPYMASGVLIRLPEVLRPLYPEFVQLHDRTETWAQYRALTSD